MSTHNEIQQLLSALRSRIRQYVLLEGVAAVLVVVGLLFWITLALDWAYFLSQRAELPVWFRFIVSVSGLAAVVLTGVGWIWLRFAREFRRQALALVLEKRFPTLNDRLITAVELESIPQEGLTAAMMERTVQELREILSRLNLTEVFDQKPLRRTGGAALISVLSIVAFAGLFSDHFTHWFRRNVLMADDHFVRETAIEVYVLAPPNDRKVEFRDGIYKHPRGVDLTLVARVLPEKLVPEQVQVRWSGHGGGGRAFCSQVGEREFKHTLTGVTENLDFWFQAGDAERTRYRIIVVDAPRVDAVTLWTMRPDYMLRANNFDDQGNPVPSELKVQGSEVGVPAGSQFDLQIAFSKPIQNLSVELGDAKLLIDGRNASLTLFQVDGARRGGTIPIPSGTNWIAEDRGSVRIPCIIMHPKHSELVGENGQVHLPIPLGASTQIRISLVDTEDVFSLDPARLTISSIEDQPPQVNTLLRGIGSSITRKALIPVTGNVTDDYGVELAEFLYKIDEAETYSNRLLSRSPDGTTDFQLQLSAVQPFERFEVLPLELKAGQKLTLTVFAKDGDNLSGPHEVRGEAYVFEIVTDEELLSQLHARELELRLRFERIIEELRNTRKDLGANPPKIDETDDLRKKSAENPESQTRLGELENEVISSAERARQGLGKNLNENRAIEQSFRDIREEMVNNVVDTPEVLSRLDEKIINALKKVNDENFKRVDDAVSAFRLALEDKINPRPTLEESLSELDQLISAMDEILVEMKRMETFQELIELLKAIKTQQEQLHQKTEKERKRRILEGIE